MKFCIGAKKLILIFLGNATIKFLDGNPVDSTVESRLIIKALVMDTYHL